MQTFFHSDSNHPSSYPGILRCHVNMVYSDLAFTSVTVYIQTRLFSALRLTQQINHNIKRLFRYGDLSSDLQSCQVRPVFINELHRCRAQCHIATTCATKTNRLSVVAFTAVTTGPPLCKTRILKILQDHHCFVDDVK